jgi:hypothetical protein
MAKNRSVVGSGLGVIFCTVLMSCGSPAEPTAAPATPTSNPAVARPAGTDPAGLRGQFAADIAAADAAIDGCAPADPVDQRADPGCADALTTMALVAYEIRSAARSRRDSAAYTGVIKAVDDMERSIDDFNTNVCHLGYRASLASGGSPHDQNCSAYGFAVTLGWLTIQMALRTVEPG